VRLLLGRAAAKDQFGSDLGPGAKRADADIAARQFFRHDDHAGLGQTEPAEFLGDGQAEHAHLGELLDDLHRDQLVAQVPAMGMGGDLFICKAAELVADHLQFLVQTRGAEGGAACVVGHQFHKAHPGGLAVALGAEPLHRRVHHPALVMRRQAHVDRADDLVLAHRDAARGLRQIFAKGDLQDQRLHLAEPALFVQAQGPGLHLAQCLGIGGKPGRAMRRHLVHFQCRCRDLAIHGDCGAQVVTRGGRQRLERDKGGFGQRQQVRKKGRLGQVLSVMGHRCSPVFAYAASFRVPEAAGQQNNARGMADEVGPFGPTALPQPMAAARTSASMWSAYWPKLSANMPTSLRACAS